jgi:hypothetical protein
MGPVLLDLLRLPGSLSAGREQIRRDCSRDWIVVEIGFIFSCLMPTTMYANFYYFLAKESDSRGSRNFKKHR